MTLIGSPIERMHGEFTDHGNAERLIHAHGSHVKFVPAWRKWFVWDGKRWIVDDLMLIQSLAVSEVRDMITEAEVAAERGQDGRAKALLGWVNKSLDEPRVRRMIALAEGMAATPTDAFDRDPWLLNVNNGTLDLRTGEIRPHDPRDFITKIAPTQYRPAAECPVWLATLDRIMGGNANLIGFIQRTLGMALTGDVSEQVLPVWHGVGANGKSTIIDTFTAIMGDYATQAPPDLLMVRHGDEHPTEIADLQGRRLVVASETEEGRKLRIQLVKKLTGDAKLKGRFMRADYFEFTRTFKTILVTNSPPVVAEQTNAIWRRLKLVPFEVVIPPDEQDTGLMDKLRVEWPGILAWAVRGCLDWQLHGLQVPDEVKTATDNYRNEEDVLAPFFEERCILQEWAKVTRADLWAEYERWADSNRERNKPTRRVFYNRVLSIDGVRDAYVTTNGNGRKGFEGIGLCR